MARRNEAEVVLTATDRTKSAFASVNKSFGRFVGAAGVAGAVFALQKLSREGLKLVDNLAKTSQKLGIATEDLAGLRLAAERTGVSTKQLDLGIQRATRRISEAAAGTGEAKKALEELGVSAQELSQLTPDEQFRRLAEAFEEVDGQANKVRLGFKLFDAEGVALINTLEGGSEALDKAAADAARFGTAISAVQAKEVEDANDALNDAKEAVEGLSTSLAARFAPAITQSSGKFANFVAFITNDAIPAFTLLAEKLTSFQANVRTLTDIELAVRIEAGADELAEVERKLSDVFAEATRLEALRPSLLGDVTGNRTKRRAEQLEVELQLEKEAIEARLAEIRAEQQRRTDIELKAAQERRDALEAQREQFRLEQEEKEAQERFERAEKEIEEEQEFIRGQIERRLERAREFRRIAFQEAREEQRARIRQGKLEEQAAQRTIFLRQQAAAKGIQALQILFGKNKAITKALFVVEKGLAIGRTVVNTSAAAIKALAELGPIAGPPAAAAIKALGAAEVATIAATTIAGLAGGGGGGGDFGSVSAAASGAFGGGGGGPGEEFGGGGAPAGEQGVVQLIFPNLFGITPEAIDELAEALREASENRDILVVSGTGRNAELLQGANG